MNKLSCKYHPRTPARWQCSHCNIGLCPICVKHEHHVEEVFSCPVCNNYAASLGASNSITPFWQRIPQSFAYPINASSLVYIIALTILGIVVFQRSWIGAVAELAIFLVALRYSYAVLLHTALGHLAPPPLSVELITSGLELPIKQFFVFVVFGSVVGFATKLVGTNLGYVLQMGMLLCIPATVMVIATENSFSKALNPAVLFGIIRRIGWRYLLLYVFLLMLDGGSNVAVEFLYGHIPIALFISIYVFSVIYFLVIMFHLMGYVIYQYHEELGFAVAIEHEDGGQAKETKSQKPVNPILNQANILITEGKPADAIVLVQKYLTSAHGDLQAHEQYHKMLVLTKDKTKLTEHGRDYITLLLEQQRLRRAFDIFRDCLSIDPEFMLAKGSQVYPLASFAREVKGENLALKAVSNFAKRYPGHPDIPRVYLLAAKILCEQFKQDGKAKKILEDLVKGFPDHELTPEIKNYLAVVDKLTAAR